MKTYDEFLNMTQEELYDYKELVGESTAQMEFLTARLLKQNQDKIDDLFEDYWDDLYGKDFFWEI